jgi:RimJ/RimL family protein N-acetyltransferase
LVGDDPMVTSLGAQTVIRAATAADLATCVEMGVRFGREVYAGKVAVDADTILALGVRLLEQGTILVAEKDRAPIGMLGLIVLPHLFSGQPHCSEVFWWVDPDHRGCGLRLLRAGEAWAWDHGATSFHVSAPDLRVGALYERLGYTKVETAYLRTHRDGDVRHSLQARQD